MVVSFVFVSSTVGCCVLQKRFHLGIDLRGVRQVICMSAPAMTPMRARLDGAAWPGIS